MLSWVKKNVAIYRIFFIFVPMELEKDGEEMKRKSTVTIPEKQEFKADP